MFETKQLMETAVCELGLSNGSLGGGYTGKHQTPASTSLSPLGDKFPEKNLLSVLLGIGAAGNERDDGPMPARVSVK